MSSPIVTLKKTLAHAFGYENAVMLGRARSGLVALIEILQKGTGDALTVLLPENICPILVSAIVAGGGRAVTVLVSPMTGLPSDEAFVCAMKQSGGVGIVMPTHLYGFQGDYPETVKYAQEKGWFILENDTNVVRMNSQKKPFGDALLVSFGYAKPVDLGTGGALLTNDGVLARRLKNHICAYGLLDDKARALEEQIMLKRRAIRANLDTKSDALKQICAVESSLCLFRFDERDADLLLMRLAEFPAVLEKRLERRALWDQALAPLDDIIMPVALEQPVPWRVIRRVPLNRDYFAEALRAHDIDAGINYRSLWREMPKSMLSGEHHGHDIWGEVVLNLWVSQKYDKKTIEKAADILMEAADAIKT